MNGEHRAWITGLLPLLLISLAGSSVAALAYALRGPGPVTLRSMLAALASSAVASMIVFFAVASYVTAPGVLVAVSILAGVGGWSVLDLLLSAGLRFARRWLAEEGDDE